MFNNENESEEEEKQLSVSQQDNSLERNQLFNPQTKNRQFRASLSDEDDEGSNNKLLIGGIPLQSTYENKEWIKPFQCYICSNVSVSPMRCSACASIYCKSCLKPWSNQSQQNKYTCIKCSQNTLEQGEMSILIETDLKPDLNTEKFLQDIKVDCPFKVNGCNEILSYSQYEEHIKECPQRNKLNLISPINNNQEAIKAEDKISINEIISMKGNQNEAILNIDQSNNSDSSSQDSSLNLNSFNQPQPVQSQQTFTMNKIQQSQVRKFDEQNMNFRSDYPQRLSNQGQQQFISHQQGQQSQHNYPINQSSSNFFEKQPFNQQPFFYEEKQQKDQQSQQDQNPQHPRQQVFQAVNQIGVFPNNNADIKQTNSNNVIIILSIALLILSIAFTIIFYVPQNQQSQFQQQLDRQDIILQIGNLQHSMKEYHRILEQIQSEQTKQINWKDWSSQNNANLMQNIEIFNQKQQINPVEIISILHEHTNLLNLLYQHSLNQNTSLTYFSAQITEALRNEIKEEFQNQKKTISGANLIVKEEILKKIGNQQETINKLDTFIKTFEENLKQKNTNQSNQVEKSNQEVQNELKSLKKEMEAINQFIQKFNNLPKTSDIQTNVNNTALQQTILDNLKDTSNTQLLALQEYIQGHYQLLLEKINEISNLQLVSSEFQDLKQTIKDSFQPQFQTQDVSQSADQLLSINKDLKGLIQLLNETRSYQPENQSSGSNSSNNVSQNQQKSSLATWELNIPNKQKAEFNSLKNEQNKYFQDGLRLQCIQQDQIQLSLVSQTEGQKKQKYLDLSISDQIVKVEMKHKKNNLSLIKFTTSTGKTLFCGKEMQNKYDQSFDIPNGLYLSSLEYDQKNDLKKIYFSPA